MEYHCPGNIRELENVIERAVNIITGPVVLAEHIILDHDLSPQPDAFPSSGVRSLDEVVSEAERAALAQALEKYPSARKLGSAMGISHTAVLKKLKKYALSLPKNR